MLEVAITSISFLRGMVPLQFINACLLRNDILSQSERNIKVPCIVLRPFDLSFFLPGIPFGCVKQVAAGKECVQIQSSEIAHGLEGGAFHLYRDAAVRFRTISTR